ISIAGVARGGTINIGKGTAKFPNFPGVIGGPVVVDSIDGLPLIVTERTTWIPGDLEEVQGVFDGYLTKKAYFTWYDTADTGGSDWVVVTNFGGSSGTV